MKKFVSMLILVMLLVGLVLNSSATTVPGDIYVEPPTEVLSSANDTIAQGAPVSANDTIAQGAPILPRTGGIPMFAFMGTGVLLIVVAVVISGKKQKTAK